MSALSGASRALRILELVVFALALAFAGIVVFAMGWSGEAPYRDLARDNHVSGYTFIVLDPKGGQLVTDLDGGVAIHQRWSQYVTGGTEEAPQFQPALFTDDEYGHMADVRRVFDVVKFFAPAAIVVIVVRLQRARARSPRDMWLLVRDGALLSVALTGAIAVFAVVAFDQLFLLFHELFFPQGNFLFDPATSNLLRVWPEWYWEGMFLRVGLSFIALAVALALVASLRLRTAK